MVVEIPLGIVEVARKKLNPVSVDEPTLRFAFSVVVAEKVDDAETRNSSVD